MRNLGIVVLGAALAGCSVTLPVAVISKNGQVLRGTTTAGLDGGSFQATDGKLTWSGNLRLPVSKRHDQRQSRMQRW